MKRISMAGMVAASVTMIFAGAALAEETVSIWFHAGTGVERQTVNSQIEEFNKMNAGTYKIEAIQLPDGSYNDQVQAAALAGKLPCMLDFDGPFLYNYAWSGYLIPLDNYMSAELRNDLLPSILAQGNYAGKIYGLGTFDSGLAIWGNKAYLEKAGVRIPTSIDDAWTKEEFVDALEKLNALPEVKYAIDFKMNYGQGEWYSYGYAPILQSFGGDLINRSDYQSAEGALNGPEAVEAMTFFKSLFDKGYANTNPAGDDDFYGKKTSALAYVGHWQWMPHHDGLGDDLAVIPMPKLGKKAATGMGSWAWGITSSCPNPDAAWKFLESLLSTEQVLRMSDANGAVPARKTAIAKSKLYSKDGPLNIFVQQLERGVAIPRPVTPAYPTITLAFSEALASIMSGSDVKAALDKAVEKIDQDIKDNQGYPMPE